MFNKNAAIFFMLLCCSAIGCAATLKEAINARNNHHYQDSIKQLNKVKGNDVVKQYLFGYNYNRLNNPKVALYHLNQAKSLGYKGPSLWIERGLANLQLGHLRQAINDLNQYDRLRPNQAKTYELLGHCYALLGNTEKANFYLDKAAADPILKPQITRFKKGLRLMEAWQASGNAEKPWQFSASLGGGYNSNVIALGNNFALPTDISRKSSPFAELSLSGYNILKQDDESSLRVLYQFLGDIYEEISSLNYLAPNIDLEYRRRLNERSNFSFDVASNNSWVGDNRFSSFITAKPSLSYQLDRWNTAELSYAYSNGNFFTPTLAVFNRDGFNHFLAITDYVRAPDSDLLFRCGYASSWNNTKGSDFAHHNDMVFVGLQNPLPYKLTLQAFYAYTLYRYDNLNSLAGSGFAFKRRDNTNRYSLQLLRELSKKTSLYCRYENFDDNANIPVYSYKQYIFSMGLTTNWS